MKVLYTLEKEDVVTFAISYDVNPPNGGNSITRYRSRDIHDPECRGTISSYLTIAIYFRIDNYINVYLAGSDNERSYICTDYTVKGLKVATKLLRKYNLTR